MHFAIQSVLMRGWQSQRERESYLLSKHDKVIAINSSVSVRPQPSLACPGFSTHYKHIVIITMVVIMIISRRDKETKLWSDFRTANPPQIKNFDEAITTAPVLPPKLT